MIVTALIFATLFLSAIAPGLVLCRASRSGVGWLAAIATASLVVSMLATALLGIAVDFLFGRALPAISLLPVSLALLGAAMLQSRTVPTLRPVIEWQPLATTMLFLGYGVIAYHMAFGRSADGSLLVHAWYNADWFKHVAHVNALANFGVPARDIFNNAQPLHYYWLSYVLPSAASAIGGDPWTAIYLANLAYASLTCLTFYGLVRASGASAALSAFAVLLATIVTGRVQVWSAVMGKGAKAFLGSPEAPPEPALASLSLYVPQHALALSLLLGWALITLTGEPEAKQARRLSLVALAAVMTVSTLFGAMLLSIYGIVELLRRRLGAAAELAAMAIGSVLFVVLLEVFKLSDPLSAVSSRIEDTSGAPHPAKLGIIAHSLASLTAALGFALFAGLYALYKLKPRTSAQRNLRLLCAALIGTPFICLPIIALTAGESIAYEVYLRALNPPAIAFGILGGWALCNAFIKRHRRLPVVAICTTLTIFALPAALLREAWHGQLGDGFTTIIPADDLAVLAALRAHTENDTVVWQYPENAFLGDPPGRDTWAPIFAGRAVLASPRATDLRSALDNLDAEKQFFAGKDVPIPDRIGAVYLSRALHPASYDALVMKMKANPSLREDDCRVSACLFLRRAEPKL